MKGLCKQHEESLYLLFLHYPCAWQIWVISGFSMNHVFHHPRLQICFLFPIMVLVAIKKMNFWICGILQSYGASRRSKMLRFLGISTRYFRFVQGTEAVLSWCFMLGCIVFDLSSLFPLNLLWVPCPLCRSFLLSLQQNFFFIQKIRFAWMALTLNTLVQGYNVSILEMSDRGLT